MPLYDPNATKMLQQRRLAMPTGGGYDPNQLKAPQQRPMPAMPYNPGMAKGLQQRPMPQMPRRGVVGGPMSRPPAMANLVNKGYGFVDGGPVR